MRKEGPLVGCWKRRGLTSRKGLGPMQRGESDRKLQLWRESDYSQGKQSPDTVQSVRTPWTWTLVPGTQDNIVAELSLTYTPQTK